VGAEIVLFDGRGGAWLGRVESVGRRDMQVFVQQEMADPGIESPLRITVAQGLARGARMEQVIRHGTELGVAGFVPVICERSTRRKGSEERWRTIARDAARQSGRTVVPSVAELVVLARLLERPTPALRLVLDTRDAAPLRDVVTGQVDDVVLLVGPEGGLSNAELRAAVTAGFRAVSLGPRVLRTETAALAAVAALQFSHGDW